jgi:hypothetical protein
MRTAAKLFVATFAGLALAIGILFVGDRTIAHADNGTLSDVQTAASLQQKLATEQRIAAAQAAARNLVQPTKNPRRPSGPPATPQPWPTGIFESAQAPFSTALYVITNQWQARIGDEYIQIYAGAKTADPTQGVIVVLTTSAIDLSDHSAQTGGVYVTTEKLGALRIASASGTRLSITTPGGKTFVFDAVTRSLAAQ